jgi:predicted porin
MNKKLIAAAIAAVVAAPAAMAELNVYGKAHVSLDQNDSDATGADMWALNDRGSRLGFKGSEDLGNGLKAIFKYEMVYDLESGPLATGGAVLGSRNSYVGLSGDFGTVLAGSHDTPTKVALYATGTEMLGDTIMQLTGSGDFTLLNMDETRSGGTIAYISPSFSGLTAAVAVVPDEGATGGDGIADHWSAGVMYKGNGIKAGLGYEDLDTLRQTWNVGASYTMDMFTVGAIYQDQDSDASAMESNMWAITGKATFGNNAVIATYGETETENVAAADGDAFGIAVEHNLSKRTKAYAAYTTKDVDGVGTSVVSVAGDSFNQGDQFSVGMFHNF